MNGGEVDGDRSVVWSAVVAALSLLLVTYAIGYELLRSWTFTIALVVAGVSALGLVATAVSPPSLQRVWTRRQPTWSAVVLPVTAGVVVYVWLAGSLTVGLLAFGVPLLTSASYLLARATRRALGRHGRRLPRHIPAWFQLPLVGLTGIGAYLLAVDRLHFFAVAFLVSTSLFSLYVWVVLPLGVIGRKTDVVDPDISFPRPQVDVLVPAYNEAETIERCVSSILATDYPDDAYHVTVVDDGSTDDTAAIAERFPDDHVTVLRKENGGKYSALNYALLCTTSEIVVSVDADSALESDAIPRSVAKLQTDPNTAAIAGNVKVENRDRLLTKLQALEYIIGINTFRRAFALFGVVPVVPGCLGVFRRDALDSIDGYDPDTVTEDFDLTLQLLKRGWAVRTTEAVVWTEAPFTWRDFYVQRKRWARGGLQTLYKHLDVLTTPEVGHLHRFMYPLKAVSLLSVPLILPAIILAVLLGPIRRVAMLTAFFSLLMFFVTAVAVASEREDYRLMLYFPFFVVGYRQLLDYTVLRSLVALILRLDGDWGEIRRGSRLTHSAADEPATSTPTTTTNSTND